MPENKVYDAITPYMREVAKTFPDYVENAFLYAIGHVRKKTKEGMLAESPGGSPYTPHNKYIRSVLNNKGHARSISSYLSEAKTHARHMRGPNGESWVIPESRPDYPIPAGLRYAARYKYFKDEWKAEIGWLAGAGKYSKYTEYGNTVQVTTKMRKLLAAYGTPVSKNKHTITIPARPTINPEFNLHKGEIAPNIEKKLKYFFDNGGVDPAPRKKGRRSS